jgi:hypothetical protein
MFETMLFGQTLGEVIRFIAIGSLFGSGAYLLSKLFDK